MAFNPNSSTAGVYHKEQDVSNRVASVGTSVGALVVRAPRGVSNREVIISDYDQYKTVFGDAQFSTSDQDVPTFGYGNYAAQYFLSESNELHVVRVTDSSDKFPSVKFTNSFTKGDYWTASAAKVDYSGVSAIMTPSAPDTATSIAAIDGNFSKVSDKLLVGALGPGTDGQNIAITVESFNMSADWLAKYDDFPTNVSAAAIFSNALNGTYTGVSAFDVALSAVGYNSQTLLPVATKIVKINVYNKKDSDSWTIINTKLGAGDILWSDIAPVETFYGTLDYQKDSVGNQLRLKEVINGISNYVYVACNGGTFANEILPKDTKIFPLSGGNINAKSGLATTDAAILTGWDFFANKEYNSVNILIAPDWNTTLKQKINTIAANRIDCIPVAQSGQISDDSVAKVKLAEKYGYKDASTMALYAGWDKIYDGTNGRELLIPKAIFGAMLMARVDRVGRTWDAPAGTDVGIIPSLGQNKIFTFQEIGQLSDVGINTSRWMKQFGHVMWSQKTAQIKKSALDRINVRRLLIYIKMTMETLLSPMIFNVVNDDKTRLRVEGGGNGFFSTLKGGDRPGIQRDSKVVCNDKNNTADVIDANILAVDLIVDPSRVVEQILVTTTVTRTGGVQFAESLIG